MPFSRARATLTVLVVIVVPLLLGCSNPKAVLTKRDPTPGLFNFTIMTFNVHRDKAGDEDTIRAIGEPNADIVCLQEITPEWSRIVRERYASQYAYIYVAPKDNAGGLALLSHYKLEDLGVIPVPGDLHPAWHFLVHTPSGTLQVMHVHLRSMFDGDSNFISNYFSKDEDHLMEIELFMSRSRPDLPTLVVGDFNESPKGEAVRWLQDRGYQNALRLFDPKQNTWRGKLLFFVLKMTIDHVMFDPSFEPLDAWAGFRGASDHYPVLARFEVPAWKLPVSFEPQTWPPKDIDEPMRSAPRARELRRATVPVELIPELDLDDPGLDFGELEKNDTPIPDPPR